MDPSKELQSMDSIIHNMMTQLTRATMLSAEQRMIQLQMENQLRLLREKLQRHEEASSAAARTVVQLDKETSTEPLPEVNAVKVLKAVEVINEEHANQQNVPVYHSGASVPKKRNKAAEEMNGDGEQQTEKKKPKIGKNKDAEDAENPKPLKGWLLFQHTVMHNSAYEKEAQVLKSTPFAERSSYLKLIYDALSDEDKDAYKKGLVPTIKAPASANAVQKAEKAIETDSDDDDLESWEFDDLITEFQHKFQCFDQEQLNHYSLWIIAELEHPWANLSDSDSKDRIFRQMCNQKCIWNMTKFNLLLKDTFENYLSKPCFLEDEEWDAQVVSTFEEWKNYVPSASLDLFNPESALHTCIVSDFQTVKKQMQELLESSISFDWPTFATELLVLCYKQNGNAFSDGSDKSREFLLTCVEGQFRFA
jgi:hypothetical protein